MESGGDGQAGGGAEASAAEAVGLRDLRDLAVLQRDRLGDGDGARQTCLRALTGTGADRAGADDDPDEWRLARYELTTLYLRLCPVQELNEALEVIGADRLPWTERLLVRAFALGRHGDCDDWAVRMFHEALARDPYHPGGLYDLACTLARSGYVRGARSAFESAIRDGGPRLAERFAHDPDVAGLGILSEADQARATEVPRHSLMAFQVRPAYDPGGIVFRVRQGLGERAADEFGPMLEFGSLHPTLRMQPEYVFLPDTVEEFVLDMRADRARFRGWDLHCALRAIAALAEDTYGFAYDWNVGGYLDEIAVADGQLTLIRRQTGICDVSTRLELLKERVRLAPDDHLLAEAVRHVLRDWGEQ